MGIKQSKSLETSKFEFDDFFYSQRKRKKITNGILFRFDSSHTRVDIHKFEDDGVTVTATVSMVEYPLKRFIVSKTGSFLSDHFIITFTQSNFNIKKKLFFFQ